jgi:hypothetical protein
VHALRFLVVGVLVGLGLPAVATLVEARLHFDGDLLAAQRGSPVLWILDTTPVVLGALAWLVGRRQDQVAELEEGRAAAFTRTAAELSRSASALFRSVSAFSAMASATAASVRETTRTMTGLSQTAMRAALTAETVIGLRGEAERAASRAAGEADPPQAGALRDAARAAQEIAAVAQQQDRGIDETLKALNAIYAAVQEVASQTGQVEAQARALTELASALSAQVQAPPGPGG